MVVNRQMKGESVLNRLKACLLTSMVAFALVGAIVISPLSLPETANKAKEISTISTSKTTSTSFNFEHEGVTYKNEYERLLAKDGFIYGMDVTWFGSFAKGKTSVGDNHVLGQASGFEAEKWRKDLYNIKALGFNSVNIWLITDGVGGLLFDDSGLVTGLDDNFLKNIRTMFEIARDVGIDVVPSIQPHGKSDNYYFGTSDETAYEIAYKYLRFYWDSEGRNAYMNNAIEPMCEILADYQDIIPIVNLTVENATNMINDTQTGMFYAEEYGSMTWANFASFINELNAQVKDKMPTMMTSVEDIAWNINFIKYNDVDVDLIGRNGYDKTGNVADPQNLYITKPMYLGEFNTFEGKDDNSEETKTNVRISFFPNALEKGYIGGFFFTWDRAEGEELSVFTSPTGDDYSTMKGFAVPLANTIRDLKYAYHGTPVDVDQPKMLYYTGGNNIYFLGSRDVAGYTVERSTDGGIWKKLDITVDPDYDSLVNGIMHFVDNTLESGHSYAYRVTAYNDYGDKEVSDASNTAEYFVPAEMLEHGSFEEGAIDNGGWYTRGSVDYPFGVYTTDTARTGNYSVYVNWAEGAGKLGTGDSQWACQWATDATLTPNARYRLSFWYKDANRGDGSLSVTVRNKDNENLCWTTINSTEEEDHEWHEMTVDFVAPPNGEVMLVLMGSYRYDLSIKCYLDDFSIKEIR